MIQEERISVYVVELVHEVQWRNRGMDGANGCLMDTYEIAESRLGRWELFLKGGEI